jgi:hypothetical protein
MLLAQALGAPRFKQECSRCHDSAASLLRDTAVLHGQHVVDAFEVAPLAKSMGVTTGSFYWHLI